MGVPFASRLRRYNTELGEFRLWARTADAAVKQSGVEAEQVLELVAVHRRATTLHFWRAGYANLAMSVPPWRISGATAALGGEGNVLNGAAHAPAATNLADGACDEESEMDDDVVEGAGQLCTIPPCMPIFVLHLTFFF